MLGFYVFAAFLCFMFFLGQEKKPERLVARLTAGTGGSTRGKITLRSLAAAFVSSLAAFLAARFPQSDTMRRRLQNAGIRMNSGEFYAMKVIVAGGAVLLCGLFGTVWPAVFSLALIAAPIGYILPEFWLSSMIKKRALQLDRNVPLMIDILALSVDAGLPLYTALQYVARYLPGALGEELKYTEYEINAGLPRPEALKNLASRTGLQSLGTLATTVVSAEKYGVPVKDVLFDLSAQIRGMRRAVLQERANKAAVKLAAPVIFFIIVPLFIIILGPTVIGLADVFN